MLHQNQSDTLLNVFNSSAIGLKKKADSDNQENGQYGSNNPQADYQATVYSIYIHVLYTYCIYNSILLVFLIHWHIYGWRIRSDA